MKTLNLKPKQLTLETSYVNKLLGTQFSVVEIQELLSKMRYGIEKKTEDELIVYIPPYRTDILHPIDLVEDVAIAYGYDKFKPELPEIASIGSVNPFEKYADIVRDLMIGFSFQEVMTLIMTNKHNLYTRMNLPEEEAVEAENPVSAEHSVARTWIMPSLLSVLEKNKNREYPQKIFEIGECITGDCTEKKKLCALIAHSKANFSETKAILTGLLESISAAYEIKNGRHGSFIEGRCGIVKEPETSKIIGFYGEIHPIVLENFSLETPVSGFEIDLTQLYINRKTNL